MNDVHNDGYYLEPEPIVRHERDPDDVYDERMEIKHSEDEFFKMFEDDNES